MWFMGLGGRSEEGEEGELGFVMDEDDDEVDDGQRMSSASASSSSAHDKLSSALEILRLSPSC
jgi:hypothetical protein